MDAVGNALRDLKQHPDKMVLLGMTPTPGQEAEYGYIQTQSSLGRAARGCGGLYREASLPACTAADHEGALWNTMVFTVKKHNALANGGGQCAFR
jgi:mannose-1-phosphate guanylyltransferase